MSVVNISPDYQKQLSTKVTVEAADDTAGFVDIVVTTTPTAYTDFFITGVFITDSTFIEKTSGFDIQYLPATGVVRVADNATSLVTTGDIISISGHLI